MNLHALPDALDAWHGKRLMAHARASEQIQDIALRHPSNKFVQLVLASNIATKQSSANTMQLIKDLEPQGISLDAIRSAPTRDQLMQNANDLRAAEARAALALPDYLAILDSERSVVEHSGRQIYADDPIQLLPGFMEAFERRESFLRERMGKMFKAIGALYSATGDVAEFLARYWDEYRIARISKASPTFTDQTINSQYNKLVAKVNGARTEVAALERDNRKFNSDQKTLLDEIMKFGSKTWPKGV
jgi:hypothetical protein